MTVLHGQDLMHLYPFFIPLPLGSWNLRTNFQHHGSDLVMFKCGTCSSRGVAQSEKHSPCWALVSSPHQASHFLHTVTHALNISSIRDFTHFPSFSIMICSLDKLIMYCITWPNTLGKCKKKGEYHFVSTKKYKKKFTELSYLNFIRHIISTDIEKLGDQPFSLFQHSL